jgi:tetratricopeptide (TPR) repeat protein
MLDQQGAAAGRISFLNVGTKILLKDTMDQFVRTLGDFKTFYAPTMSSALRTFQDNTINVIISEVDLGDGSVYRLVRELGGTHGFHDDDLYVVLALEERTEHLMALADEIEAHAVLVKPFSAADLRTQIEKYKAWRVMPKDPWQVLVQEAYSCAREKKFREAENNFKEAISVAPGNPVPLLRAGMYYAAKPDYAIAELLLKKALLIKPNYVQAMSALGTVALMRRELEKAEDYFRKANEISPLNPDRQVELVRLYVDRCIESCRTALRLDPSSSAARALMGKLLTVAKDYAGAVRELEKVMYSLKDEAKLEVQTYAALARKLGGIAK